LYYIIVIKHIFGIYMGITSIANRILNRANQAPKEVTTQKTSIIHIAYVGAKIAAISLASSRINPRTQNARRDTQYALAQEKSVLSQLNGNTNGVPEAQGIAQGKIDKLQEKLNSYDNLSNKLTGIKTNLTTELENSGKARVEINNAKTEKKQHKQAERKRIIGEVKVLSKQAKSLASEFLQVRANSKKNTSTPSIVSSDIFNDESVPRMTRAGYVPPNSYAASIVSQTSSQDETESVRNEEQTPLESPIIKATSGPLDAEHHAAFHATEL
jgi:hypothetical protein